jgi:hypothetical protein
MNKKFRNRYRANNYFVSDYNTVCSQSKMLADELVSLCKYITCSNFIYFEVLSLHSKCLQ